MLACFKDQDETSASPYKPQTVWGKFVFWPLVCLPHVLCCVHGCIPGQQWGRWPFWTNSNICDVTVRNLLFSDDCGLIANMKPKMQRSVDLFAKDSTNVCLNVFILFYKSPQRFCSVESLYYAHRLVWSIMPRISRFSALSGLSSFSLWEFGIIRG